MSGGGERLERGAQGRGALTPAGGDGEPQVLVAGPADLILGTVSRPSELIHYLPDAEALVLRQPHALVALGLANLNPCHFSVFSHSSTVPLSPTIQTSEDDAAQTARNRCVVGEGMAEKCHQ